VGFFTSVYEASRVLQSFFFFFCVRTPFRFSFTYNTTWIGSVLSFCRALRASFFNGDDLPFSPDLLFSWTWALFFFFAHLDHDVSLHVKFSNPLSLQGVKFSPSDNSAVRFGVPPLKLFDMDMKVVLYSLMGFRRSPLARPFSDALTI